MKSTFIGGLIVVTAVAGYGQNNPAVLPAQTGPIGLAATTTQVLYSHPFCQTGTAAAPTPQREILNLNGTLFATLPPQIENPTNPDRTCSENYFAISTGLGGFPANAVYASAVINQDPTNVSSGTNVILREPGNTVFATLPAGFAPVNHSYVSFDTVGTFGFALLVTGQSGIIGYAADGSIAFQYNNPIAAYALEGATVAPLTYSQCPGCLFVTAAGPVVNGVRQPGAILYVKPGTPSGSGLSVWTTNAPAEPESIIFVPNQFCTFTVNGVGYSYFVSGFNTPPGDAVIASSSAILAFTPAQLAPYSGQFLVPDEVTGNIYAYSGPNTRTTFSSTNYQLEGASIISCTNGTGCPATQGFFKNKGLPSALFDPTTLKVKIGNFSYTSADLISILQTPPSGGNAVLILGHQLIAALANVAAGATVTPQAALAIAQSLQLLTDNNLNLATSTVKSSTTLGQQLVALSNILDTYNSATGLNCTEGAGLSK